MEFPKLLLLESYLCQSKYSYNERDSVLSCYLMEANSGNHMNINDRLEARNTKRPKSRHTYNPHILLGLSHDNHTFEN